MEIEKQFKENTSQRIRQALEGIDVQSVQDIYAISLWKDNLDDDPQKPTIMIGYNTVSKWQSCMRASSSQEAKWNFAFWIQNDLDTIDGNDHLFAQWVNEIDTKTSGNTDALDMEVQNTFMEIIISIAQELFNDQTITKIFGRDIPIIIHELEYYDKPLSWTQRANPPGLINEFKNWVDSLR